MSAKKIALAVVLTLFLGETAYVLSLTGPNWIAPVLESPVAILLLFDLTICLSLIAIWMFRDASARGTSAWPYFAVTLLLGGAGPLLYLLRRPESEAREPAAQALHARAS
ncbi:MAG: hypothetical protein MJE66_10270 [Proteobacteria bacterium]|nr:hypothetical protein [Pseudomonadota bacterium]